MENKKFTQQTSEWYGARNAGYRLDPSAPLDVNESLEAKIVAQHGERFVQVLRESFNKFTGDMYKDEGNTPYMVTYWNGTPLYWRRLVPACYKVKEAHLEWWKKELMDSMLTPNDEGIIVGSDLEFYVQDLGIPTQELLVCLDLIDDVA